MSGTEVSSPATPVGHPSAPPGFTVSRKSARMVARARQKCNKRPAQSRATWEGTARNGLESRLCMRLRWIPLRVEAGVSTYHARRRRQARIRMLKRAALAVAAAAVICAVAVGMAFAGSSGRIAAGVRIAGIDVGGLKPADAERLLQRRYAASAKRPLVVTAGHRRFLASAGNLGIVPDWKAAIAEARQGGDGFGPIRGFRRLYVRVAGTEILAPARAYRPALDVFLARVAHAVDAPHREAALRRHGLGVEVV